MTAIIELQDKIAQGLADSMTEPWERIVVNFEMETTAEGRELDYRFFYISQSEDGSFKKTSVMELPEAVSDLFIDLNDAVFETAKDRWGTCDLTIDRTGKYNFKLDYEPPRRLNDIFDDVSMDIVPGNGKPIAGDLTERLTTSTRTSPRPRCGRVSALSSRASEHHALTGESSASPHNGTARAAA